MLPPGIVFSLLALEWLLALGWLTRLVAWLQNSASVTDLTRLPFEPLDLQGGDRELVSHTGSGLPQLSVVVPACNEEAAIEATLRSLLASVGVRLEILAVNDRSTDETGPIMRRIAAEWATRSSPDTLNHTIKVIEIESLSEGWLGKPHALAAGALAARAEWLLLTDGDVQFHPQALARALGCAVARKAGLLVLIPDLILGSPGEAAMHGMMYALSLWGFAAWDVENSKSKAFLGVGAFNLIQRLTYDAIGGMEALRLEVLEDMRLGWKVKRAGLHPVAVFGPGLVRVRWAQGAWGVVRNTEKNLFSLYRFRTWIALVASFGLALQALVPLLLLCEVLLPVPAALRAAAIAGLLLQAAAITAIYRATRGVTHVPTPYVLLFPFAVALFVFAHLRSTVLALVRGGIRWRGSFYSLRALRKHAGNWK